MKIKLIDLNILGRSPLFEGLRPPDDVDLRLPMFRPQSDYPGDRSRDLTIELSCPWGLEQPERTPMLFGLD